MKAGASLPWNCENMRVEKYIIVEKAGQEQAYVLLHSGELRLDAYSFVYRYTSLSLMVD